MRGAALLHESQSLGLRGLSQVWGDVSSWQILPPPPPPPLTLTNRTTNIQHHTFTGCISFQISMLRLSSTHEAVIQPGGSVLHAQGQGFMVVTAWGRQAMCKQPGCSELYTPAAQPSPSQGKGMQFTLHTLISWAPPIILLLQALVATPFLNTILSLLDDTHSMHATVVFLITCM